MRKLVLVAAWLVLPGTSFAADSVTVEGCPVAGVEGNCLMIQGADKQTYNITSAKPRPQPGDVMIRLTGTRTDKLSACNQGIVLDNVTWSATKQKCR